MTAAPLNITIDRAADWSKVVTITDSGGGAVALTAAVTGVKQVETAATSGTVSADGVVAVSFVSALTGTVSRLVTVTAGDTPTVTNAKICQAFNGDPHFSAHFKASYSTGSLIATALAAAANDSTVNWSVAGSGTTATGVSAAPTSADTTAGVAQVFGLASFKGQLSVRQGSPSIAEFRFEIISGGSGNQVRVVLPRSQTANLSPDQKYHFDWFADIGMSRARHIQGTATIRGNATVFGTTFLPSQSSSLPPPPISSFSWGDITGTLSDQTDLASALSGKQPLDADLTAIAALTTTANGRALLTSANALTIGASASVSGINTGDQDLSLYVPYTGGTTEFSLPHDIRATSFTLEDLGSAFIGSIVGGTNILTDSRSVRLPDAEGLLSLTARTDGQPDKLTGGTISGATAFASGATFIYNGTSASDHLFALGAGTTGAALFGAANPPAARTTLELGSLATINSPLPVANGGTGTTNGSITGTGALTFTSAAASNINLTPGTTGSAIITSSSTGGAGTLSITNTATDVPLVMTCYGGASVALNRRANGTIGSPSGLLANELIGGVLVRGHNGTAFTTASNGGIYVYAAENWTAGANGTRIGFETTANGGTTRTQKLGISDTGLVTVAATTTSTSTATGALIVSGGVGIAGNINAGGTLAVTGVSTLTGGATFGGGTQQAATRFALGATTTGTGLFTAVDSGAARSVLGATTTGTSVFIAATASDARIALGGVGDSSTGTALFGAATVAAANTILANNIVEKNADFTLEQTDAGTYMRLTKTSGTQQITLPATGISAGAEFQFYRITTQALAFAGSATVNGTANLASVPTNGAFALKHISSGTYDFI